MRINFSRPIQDMMDHEFKGNLIQLHPDRVYAYAAISELNMLERALRTFSGNLYKGEAERLLLKPMIQLVDKIESESSYVGGDVQSTVQTLTQNYRVISLYLRSVIQSKSTSQSVTRETLDSSAFIKALNSMMSVDVPSSREKAGEYQLGNLTAHEWMKNPAFSDDKGSAVLLARLYEFMAQRDIAADASPNSVPATYDELISSFGIGAGVPLDSKQKAYTYNTYVRILNAVRKLLNENDYGTIGCAEGLLLLYWFRMYLIATGILDADGNPVSREDRLGIYAVAFPNQQLQSVANTQNDQLRLRADEMISKYFLPMSRLIPSFMLAMTAKVWDETIEIIKPVSQGQQWNDAIQLYEMTRSRANEKVLAFATNYVERYVSSLLKRHHASGFIPSIFNMFNTSEVVNGETKLTEYGKLLDRLTKEDYIYNQHPRVLIRTQDSVRLKSYSIFTADTELITMIIRHLSAYHTIVSDLIELEQIVFQTVDDALIPVIDQSALPVVLIDETLMSEAADVMTIRKWTHQDPLARVTRQWIYKGVNDDNTDMYGATQSWIKWVGDQSTEFDAVPRWIGEFFILKCFWLDKFQEAVTDKGRWMVWDPGYTFIADPLLHTIVEQPIPFLYTRDRSVAKRRYNIVEWEKAMFARGEMASIDAEAKTEALAAQIYSADAAARIPVLDALSANVLVYFTNDAGEFVLQRPAVPYIWGAPADIFIAKNEMTSEAIISESKKVTDPKVRVFTVNSESDAKVAFVLHKTLPLLDAQGDTKLDDLKTITDALNRSSSDADIAYHPYAMSKQFFVMVSHNKAVNDKAKSWAKPCGLSPYRTCLPHLTFSVDGVSMTNSIDLVDDLQPQKAYVKMKVDALTRTLQFRLSCDRELHFGDMEMWEQGWNQPELSWPTKATKYIPYDTTVPAGVESDPGVSMNQEVDIVPPATTYVANSEVLGAKGSNPDDAMLQLIKTRETSMKQGVESTIDRKSDLFNAGASIEMGVMPGVLTSGQIKGNTTKAMAYTNPGDKADPDKFLEDAFDVMLKDVDLNSLSSDQKDKLLREFKSRLAITTTKGVSVVSPDKSSVNVARPYNPEKEVADLAEMNHEMQGAVDETPSPVSGSAEAMVEMKSPEGDIIKVAPAEVEKLERDGYVIIKKNKKPNNA